MGDTIGATFLMLFVFYSLICAVAVPVMAWEEHAAERQCAASHQVFACEKLVEWKPKEATND